MKKKFDLRMVPAKVEPEFHTQHTTYKTNGALKLAR